MRGSALQVRGRARAVAGGHQRAAYGVLRIPARGAVVTLGAALRDALDEQVPSLDRLAQHAETGGIGAEDRPEVRGVRAEEIGEGQRGVEEPGKDGAGVSDERL